VPILYILGIAFTVWAAVDAAQHGRTSPWLWIILMFPPFGALVYFLTHHGDDWFIRLTRHSRRKVTAADLAKAQAEVLRLDNAANWLDYASALRARKDYKRAVEAASKAVERDAANIDAQYELALALIAAGRLPDAAAPLERVIARSRSHDSEAALFAFARTRLAAGDAAGARDLLEEIGGRSTRPEFLYEWAAVAARLGRREEAARALQRIIVEGELVPNYLKSSVRPWIRKARHGLRRLGF
jgi:tetratricopeptide (TPR) repeat protein